MEKGRKLRILHVLKSSIYSGAENVVITIMKALQDEFDMVYVATDGEIRARLEQEQIPMELLPKFDRQGLKAVIQKYQPDVVHAHDFSATVLCASLNGRNEFRLISHLHHNPPWVMKWNLKTMVYRLCKAKIDKVITVTERAFDSMIFAKGYQEKQVTLRNLIDRSYIEKMADQAANLDGIEDVKNVYGTKVCDLLFVGRLEEPKNPLRFIELIGQLKQRGFDGLHVWMIGDGILRDQCEKKICELGLQNQIEMKGFQKNPYCYMKKARLLCITSQWEGFGLVALEANLLGVPVVSTRTSGCTEVLGEDAWELCSTDEEFIEKIEMLLTDPVKMEEWKEESLKRTEKLQSLEDYKAVLRGLYKSEVSK